MKRYIWLLIVVLACALTACSGAQSAPGEGTGQGTMDQGIDEGVEQETVNTDTVANSEMPIQSQQMPIAEGDVTLSAASGVYGWPFELQLSTKIKNGEIYYTLDGSDPVSSETAIRYTQPIKVTERNGDANVVSAVEPVLIAGSYNKVKNDKSGFVSTLSVPSSEAVDKCTVVRAVVKTSDGSVSEENSATYFIGTMEEHIQGIVESCEAAGSTLAVVSITMDYADLFDEKTGIYVKGDTFRVAYNIHRAKGEYTDGETARSLDANYKQKGRDWEREARVSFYECDAEGMQQVLVQDCGIRIQGNYSRSDMQKGLRLYARNDYGENNFDYAFFGEDYKNDMGETMDKYKTLILRAGGNCAFTAKYNDTYWQSLVEELDCGTQKSRPCVVYLNGEYWGLYVLQEDYTDDYMEDKHGVTKEDVVIYKGDAEALELGYKLDEGELPAGITDESYYFEELFSFFDTHENLQSQADYDAFCQLVDPQSVMDYFAVQCWINNKWDWPGKNWSMWRTTTSDGKEDSYGDGRWRFLFYDMEFGGVSGKSDCKTNTIKEDNYKPNGLLDMDTDNPAVLCFAYLMTNEGFREAFCQELLGLSERLLEKNAALEQLEYFEAVYGPLFEQFFTRYPGTGSAENALEGGYASSKCIRDFVSGRAEHIRKQVEFVEKVLGD